MKARMTAWHFGNPGRLKAFGACLLLGTLASGCGSEANENPFLEHGIRSDRQLTELTPEETTAVCMVNSTARAYGKQSVDDHAETCRMAGEWYGESRLDCARLGFDCLEHGDADMFLRSRPAAAACFRGDDSETREHLAHPRYQGCTATVNELEQCMARIWRTLAMDQIIRRCNALAGDHPLAAYDDCAAAPPGEGDPAANQGACEGPLPGCEAFATACPELYCSSWLVGGDGATRHPQRDTAFCQQHN